MVSPSGPCTTYSTPGADSYVVPAGVTKLKVTVVGAGGGGAGAWGNGDTHAGGAGGSGGKIVDQLVDVTPGETLTISVGEGGKAGGWNFNGNWICYGTNSLSYYGTAGGTTTLTGTQAYADAIVFGTPLGTAIPAIPTSTYDLDVTFDVGGLQQLAVPVNVTDSYDTIAATINGLLSNGTCAFVNGAFRVTSNTVGVGSTAVIAEGTGGPSAGGGFIAAVDAAAGGATTLTGSLFETLTATGGGGGAPAGPGDNMGPSASGAGGTPSGVAGATPTTVRNDYYATQGGNNGTGYGRGGNGNGTLPYCCQCPQVGQNGAVVICVATQQQSTSPIASIVADTYTGPEQTTFYNTLAGALASLGGLSTWSESGSSGPDACAEFTLNTNYHLKWVIDNPSGTQTELDAGTGYQFTFTFTAGTITVYQGGTCSGTTGSGTVLMSATNPQEIYWYLWKDTP